MEAVRPRAGLPKDLSPLACRSLTTARRRQRHMSVLSLRGGFSLEGSVHAHHDAADGLPSFHGVERGRELGERHVEADDRPYVTA